MKHVYLLVFLFFLWESIFMANTYSQWVQTNGPYGGEINCFTNSGTNFFAGTTDGVYLSTNRGMSWKKAGLINIPVSSIASIENYLFAGSASPNYGGVFLSNNNGISWTQINYGLTNKYVRSIVVIGTTLFAGTAGGVFRSTNYGNSWVQVNNGLTNTNIFTLTVNGTNLFAGTNGGVFLSTNNGSNWIAINNGIQNKSIYTIAISGTNIFAGTDSGVIRSTNTGSSWSLTNLKNVFVGELTVSGNNIFAGTYELGIFRTTDNGTNWTPTNYGLKNLIIRALTVSGTNEIFSGTDDGVFYSTNNGSTWLDRNTGLTNKRINVLAISGNNLFAGTSNGICLTTNNGTNWTEIGLNDKYVYSFAIYGSNILAGLSYGGAYLSTDNGITWINKLEYYAVYSLAIIYPRIYAGASRYILRSSFQGSTWTWENILELPYSADRIHTFATKDTTLFAGASRGRMYISTNYGKDWQSIYVTSSPSADVNSIAFSDTFILAGTRDGLFRKGINEISLYWLRIAFQDTIVRTLTVIGNKIIAGTDKGVFLSTNNGMNWTSLNDGLPNVSVYSCAISSKNIFIGTYSDGVWRRPLSELTNILPISVSLPTDFKLYQNYPNPFNPSTTIKFEIPKTTHVTLKIYNLLGEEVAELVNEEMKPGVYDINWNTSASGGIPSGVYFYRFKAGDFIKTNKMILNR